MKAPRCKQCGGRLTKNPMLLYYTPSDKPVYLCGRPKCERAYNGEDDAKPEPLS